MILYNTYMVTYYIQVRSIRIYTAVIYVQVACCMNI